MPDREIAILAKSRKCGSHCIAGKEILRRGNHFDVGEWIRPVSGIANSSGAVSDKECQYAGSAHAQVLDFARVPLDRVMGIDGQPENARIAAQVPWARTGQLAPSAFQHFKDSPDDIWLENCMPTDRVSHRYATDVTASLYLIAAQDFRVILSYDWNPYQGYHVRKIRGEFTYNGERYTNLSVTDPKVNAMLMNDFPLKGNSAKRMALPKGDEYYLCVSLGPQFGAAGCHYKFVASVLDCSGYIQRAY